ncbi:unnamed protein product [Lymnaea stagnalis]|uniref:Uncharacterized protein n=1 Tax=Lymnaea stagnalis TaxID=6523 RepID=A0AAV2HJ36_LYMST
MARRYNDTDVSEEDEDYIELPNIWPTPAALRSDNVKLVNVQDERMLRFYRRSLSEKPDVYAMKHSVRGNVLVINNEKFLKLSRREGTEKDCNKIRAVFSQLGFNVIIYNNLTGDEMNKILLRESKYDYSNHDCFILFVLSHGDKGVVVGTDAKSGKGSSCVSISYIRRLFSENKTLLGKPKLFFVEACQGSQYDDGKTLVDEDDTFSDSNIGASREQSEESDYSQTDHVIFSDVTSEDEETTDGSKIPSGSDIFLSTAAVKGYVSWRNKNCGSWYIQAIGYVFRKYAHKHNLHDLMTSVINLVSKSEANKGQFKQVATIYSTLRKKLFFFPCLHEKYVEIIDKHRLGQSEQINLEKQLNKTRQNLAAEQKMRLKLENDLKIKDSAIDNLKKECGKNENELKIVTKNLKRRERLYGNWKEKWEHEKSLYMSLAVELSGEKKTRLKLENDLKIKDVEIDNLKKECKEKENELKNVTNNLNRREKLYGNWKEKWEHEQSLNVTMAYELSGEKKMRQQLENDLKIKDVEIDNFKKVCQEKENELENVTKNLKRRERLFGNWKEKWEHEQSLNVTLADELSDEKRMRQQLENDLKIKDVEIDNFKKECVEKENKLEKVTNNLKRRKRFFVREKKIRQQLENDLKIKDVEMDNLKKEREEKENELENVTNKLNRHERLFGNWKEKWEHEQSLNVSLADELSVETKMRQQLENDLKIKDVEIENLKKRMRGKGK